MVCPLDTAAVTELWRLNLFSCTLPRSFVLVRCLREANVAIFCWRFSWSRQTSVSKGFSYYFHDSTSELHFRSTARQCRCYIKTKLTKYCLKHEGKSRPCHPWHTLVPEVFLDFSSQKRSIASTEAATTSHESDEEREKNLWLRWPRISLSCRRQLSNASNC